MVEFNEEREKERVDFLHKKEEENLAATMGERFGLPYLDLTTHPINIDALRVIKEEDARAAELAVFDLTDKRLDVGVIAPENDKTKAVLESFKERGFMPEVFMVSHESLKKVWERYKDLSYSFETKAGALDISNEEIIKGCTESSKLLPDVERIYCRMSSGT
jgi:hypothetical protein